MIDHVDKTLKYWRQSKFEYGKRDCLLSLGDYAELFTVYNYADFFRGSYSDEAGAFETARAFGGAAALIDRMGFPRAREAARGDIVLANIGVPTGGICTGETIAFRSLRGVQEISIKLVEILAIWKVA